MINQIKLYKISKYYYSDTFIFLNIAMVKRASLSVKTLSYLNKRKVKNIFLLITKISQIILSIIFLAWVSLNTPVLRRDSLSCSRALKSVRTFSLLNKLLKQVT